MTSFIEQRFPEAISRRASGGPEFSTSIAALASGHEQRNSNWSAARARYNVAHAGKTSTEFAELVAFFRAMRGRANGFRFKDWGDYQGVAQVIGTGNGSATTFQLVKHYTAGATTVSRVITKPVSGTVSIYKNSILQTSGVTINNATGVITFSSAPANGVVVSADFEFDVPVRFNTDHCNAVLESRNNAGWNDITLVEVRV